MWSAHVLMRFTLKYFQIYCHKFVYIGDCNRFIYDIPYIIDFVYSVHIYWLLFVSIDQLYYEITIRLVPSPELFSTEVLCFSWEMI